jgi:hypothetical protein
MPTAEMPWTIVFLVSRLLGITRHAFCCLTDGWLSWLKRDRLGADTRYGSIKLVSSWSIFQLTFSFLPQNHSHERTNPLIENVLYRLDWMERHEKKRERWGERTRARVIRPSRICRSCRRVYADLNLTGDRAGCRRPLDWASTFSIFQLLKLCRCKYYCQVLQKT